MRSKLVALVLIAFCAGMSEAQDATGSGVVISGNRILTNAHVVMFAGEVQVRANQSGNKLAVWNLKSTR